MAKSIKLSGDNYWDTSGLYGGQIFNSYGSISSNTTKAITIPNSFRGIVFLFRGSSTMAAYMVTSASSGGTYAAPLVTGTNITVTTSTNRLTVQNSGSANLYTFYIGTHVLS